MGEEARGRGACLFGFCVVWRKTFGNAFCLFASVLGFVAFRLARDRVVFFNLLDLFLLIV